MTEVGGSGGLLLRDQGKPHGLETRVLLHGGPGHGHVNDRLKDKLGSWRGVHQKVPLFLVEDHLRKFSSVNLLEQFYI